MQREILAIAVLMQSYRKHVVLVVARSDINNVSTQCFNKTRAVKTHCQEIVLGHVGTNYTTLTSASERGACIGVVPVALYARTGRSCEDKRSTFLCMHSESETRWIDGNPDRTIGPK